MRLTTKDETECGGFAHAELWASHRALEAAERLSEDDPHREGFRHMLRRRIAAWRCPSCGARL